MVGAVLAEYFNAAAKIGGDYYVAIGVGTAREVGRRLFWFGGSGEIGGCGCTRETGTLVAVVCRRI